MKPRVVYWNNIPTPYIVDRFNAIAARGNLDLEVWFTARTEDDRSWKVNESEWGFKGRYLPGFGSGAGRFAVPAPLFGRSAPDLMVGFYGALPYVLGWELARLRRVRTAFYVEWTSDEWNRRTRLKEAVKRYLFRRIDAAIIVGEQSRQQAIRYGTPAERTFLLPYDTDVRRFSDGRDRHLPDREGIRAELGLRGTAFLYIGRMWSGKGVDYLLDAFQAVQRTSSDEVSLLLIGDGQDEVRYRERCRTEDIANVVFAGFLDREHLPRAMVAADAFIYPTLGEPYGCAVMEAMASSLPVISTDGAGEIEQRIMPGVNGYIVPTRDHNALAEKMLLLAADPQLRSRMRVASRQMVEGKTPDKWAADFEAVAERILALPRSRRTEDPLRSSKVAGFDSSVDG